MVETEGDPANPTTLLMKQKHRAAFTTSYDEEKAAMRMALEWLLPSHEASAICTDSQSLLKAIQSGSADTTDLRRMLKKRAGKTTCGNCSSSRIRDLNTSKAKLRGAKDPREKIKTGSFS